MKPVNLTEDEEKLWQRVETLAEELARDMGAALLQVGQLPEWMKETAVNHLCSKLAEARARACSWMNDRGEP